MKRASDDLQHLYAELVEACRLGWVYRCDLRGAENRYIPHRPPIFSRGGRADDAVPTPWYKIVT